MTVLPHQLHGSGAHHVIALHGWFGDRTSYEPLMPWIDDTAFTWALMDQRGYGDARHIGGDFTIAEVAKDAVALADHLGWTTFSVVGHSMGGAVAQRIVADVPRRLRSLVGITPVPASGAGMDVTVREMFAGAKEDSTLRRAIISGSTGDRLPAAWLDYMVAHSVACSTKEAFGAYLPSWADADFHDDVAGNPAPALFLAGEHDPGLSADFLRTTVASWFPASELKILANAGHYPMDETPLALLALVESFLARH
ncbi:MAG TPA: alpha/beta hydrolase [Amycolatopsis sp.]|nr:alpha/beta hydrolase [Amycolatopsis sp.]